jgi:hypothetical protein
MAREGSGDAWELAGDLDIAGDNVASLGTHGLGIGELGNCWSDRKGPETQCCSSIPAGRYGDIKKQ